ncbi:hypothetical protein LHFGNBLO_005823 [Mesorhizobium sp. AR10]|uniref:hypothetical protein n=1 Tax=Mesorhizobium sp. AR10 TaxID=2865839 RepID=UPI002160AE2A|nr:hypothetical protein [Mesorhizobium sp. AR10]UVK38631.1 hypothetical protein LHFGNBLO_005823 [Mesorhizobium sp. AR10]
MQTIGRLYDCYAEAAGAADALQLAGVRREDITIFRSPNDDTGAVSAAPVVGAAFGSSAGLFAAPAFAMYGLLPFGAGWLATAVVGAVICGGFVGGLLGTLADSANKGLDQTAGDGVVLVIAEVDEESAHRARVALCYSQRVPVAIAA